MSVPDLQIHKTQWAPGWWTISAPTTKGKVFWSCEGFEDLGWNLGSNSFSRKEVEVVLRDAPDGLLVEVEGQFIRKREVCLD